MQRSSFIGLIGLIILSIISVSFSIFLIHSYLVQRDDLRSDALTSAEQQARVVARDITTAFSDVMTIGNNLADELTNGELPYEDIQERMFEVVTDRPDLDGLAITFEPNVYPEEELFQTYVYKTEDDIFDVLVGATYNYTARNSDDANTAWYVDTIDEGAQWHEPFFAAGAQKVLVEYGVPFYPVDADDNASPAGIVSVDYTIETMRELVESLQLGSTGYGFVLSDEGTFLAHPVSDFVVNQAFSDLIPDVGIIEAVETSQQGQQSFAEVIDPVTGIETWYYFLPINDTGWTVGIVLDVSQFLPTELQTIRDQMGIALSVTVSVFIILSTIFHGDRYNITNFWLSSAIFSMLCIGLIVIAWFITNRLETHVGVSITNQSELQRYLQSLDDGLDDFVQPNVIPTGILVQAMDFPNPTSVTVNGYVWQRYPATMDNPPGFSFPQRIGEEATIDEIERFTVDDETTVVWYVGITLRQRYDTLRFPFDHRNIVIRVAPGNLTGNVMLSPDLDAYDLTNPAVLPGIESTVNINNWELSSSRFVYIEESDDVQVSLTDDQVSQRLPELAFNINAQRIYLGPFIAYLLPGLVAAALTFAYLVSGREIGQMDEIIGALNYSAALFFVIAVLHSALRAQIAAVDITYLEYIYIFLYLAIIGVVFNIYLLARFPNLFIIQYRNNLIFKVTYIPLFAGGMLIVTLLIFVY